MAVSPALTTDEKDALLGISTLTRYLSPIPDRVLATALINQATFTYPLAQLTVDTTSADWSDVAAGMTVYVGSTPGGHEKGIFRVRKAGTGTTLYIMEVSGGDPGEIPEAIRTASFANNDYITVLWRFDIWSILPRINFNTGVIYEDWDATYSTFNETPPPLTYIYINGRRNHLFDFITGDSLAIEAVASVVKWPTSTGSTVSYSWTVPPEWTDVSGAATATLTANAPPGNYVLKCTITDSIGGAWVRWSYVNVHSADDNPPVYIDNMPRSDVRDRTGRRMSFDLYNDRVAAIPDGAAVGYFEVSTWGNAYWFIAASLAESINSSATSFDVDDGSVFAEDDIISIGAEEMLVTGIAVDTLTVTRGYNDSSAASHPNNAAIQIYNAAEDVPTATRQFIGWIQQIETTAENGLRQAQIDIISPAHLLAMLNNTSQIIKVNASPSTWQQAVASLMSASFMAWYMLVQRVGNLMHLFNFTTFSTAAAGQRLPQWQIDKGTIYQQIQLLATDRGNFGCNSEGEFFFLRLPQMVDYADRSSVVVRDEIDASIYATATTSLARQSKTVQIRGEAFSWNGSATLPTPYYSDAPVSPGQGGAPSKLLSQVVTDQNELNQLTGDYYALKNNPIQVSSTILKNRDVYEPAELPFVRVTIPDYLYPFGVEFQRYIVPISVSKRHNADGTADISLTGDVETHGLAGGTIPVPPPNSTLYTPPYTPPVVSPPPVISIGDWPPILPGGVPAGGEPTVTPGKGAIKNDETHVWRTYDNSVTSPVWDDVTPTGGFSGIVQAVMNMGTTYNRGAYVLLSDGSNGQVAHTKDIFATIPVWEYGDSVMGVWTQIVSTRGKADEIYISGTQTATEPCTNFDIGNVEGNTAFGTYLGQFGGRQRFQAEFFPDDGNYYLTMITAADNICCTLLDIVIQSGSIGVGDRNLIYCGTPQLIANFSNDNPINQSINYLAYQSNTDFTADFNFVSDTGGTFGQSRRSIDGGATFESVHLYGTIETASGFDVGRFGLVALAGDSEQVVISEDGGSYALYDSLDSLTGTYAISLKIPDLRPGSSSLSNIGTEPGLFFACAAFVGGDSANGAIFKYTVSKIDITPSVSGFKAVGVTPLGMDCWRGKMLMFLGNVDNGMTVAQYLFTTRSAGGSWLSHLHPEALSIRAQRFSTNGALWIMAQGDDGVSITTDFGVTWVNKSTDRAIYAEIFG